MNEIAPSVWKRVQIKGWTEGVQVEASALDQLVNVARLPIVGPHVAVMPDVHWGNGATVGSVIPQRGAIIPAAVGVDIGCGMVALKTDLLAADLDGKLSAIRSALENAIPIGGPGAKGSWAGGGHFCGVPRAVEDVWNSEFASGYVNILAKHRLIGGLRTGSKKLVGLTVEQLGTLGTGNHFIEVCLDEEGAVWLMLHSGSRGVGNRIGIYFIEKAKRQAERMDRTVKANEELAWLDEGTQEFADYFEAVEWAQRFARRNRDLMMDCVQKALSKATGRIVRRSEAAINCHHNYVEKYEMAAADFAVPAEYVWLTRKGAVSARLGELGIIPGSMGTKSFIVRGKGNKESFESCSHGAGRAMSRSAARRTFTVEQHEAATSGVECRKDKGVIDETPGAYKSIDAVMAAQTDLVEVVATLKQVVCVKG